MLPAKSASNIRFADGPPQGQKVDPAHSVYRIFREFGQEDAGRSRTLFVIALHGTSKCPARSVITSRIELGTGLAADPTIQQSLRPAVPPELETVRLASSKCWPLRNPDLIEPTTIGVGIGNENVLGGTLGGTFRQRSYQFHRNNNGRRQLLCELTK
jgi:hypothetical protein